MITLIARFKAAAGKEDALQAALGSCVAPTRQEEGCHTYILHRDTKDPALFVFYEIWQDQAALDEHMRTAHFKRTIAEATPCLAEPFGAQFLRPLS